MNYRDRIFKRYGSVFKSQGVSASDANIDRWGDSYETYLANWLPDSRTAMIGDLACGQGWLLRFFARRGYQNLVGVDVSPEQVQLARRHTAHVEQGDLLGFLHGHAGKFDLLTGLDIIEHLTKDEVLCFLDACHGALRPGGRIVLQTPNGESPFGGSMRYGDFTHETCFTPVLLGQLLELTGFSRTECRECRPVARGTASLIRAGLWRLIRLQLLLWNLAETGTAGSRILTRVFIASAIKA